MAAAVAVLVMGATVATPASATETFTIALHVTTSTGANATGGCLYVHPYLGTTTVVGTDCVGDGNGNFSVDGLAAGTYYLSLRGFAGTAFVQDVRLDPNSTSFASGVVVGSPGDFAASVALLPPYSVIGRVTAENVGIEGATASLVDASTNEPVATVATDAGGFYVIQPPTTPSASQKYYLSAVADGYVTSWGPSQNYQQLATPFSLSVDSLQGANRWLDRPASVSVNLSAPDTVEVVEDLCLFVYVFRGGTKYFQIASECGEVGSTITFDPISPAVLYFCVASGDGADSRCSKGPGRDPGAAWYGGTGASPRYVYSGSHLEFSLAWGGTMVGYPSYGGEALVGGCMVVTGVASDCDGSDGYEIQVAHDVYNASAKFTGFAGYVDPAQSFSFTVSRGAVTVYSQKLVPRAHVSGAVSLPDVADPGTTCVTVLKDSATVTEFAEQCGDGATFTYDFELDPGWYRLRFESTSPDVAREWYNDAPSDAEGQRFYLAPAETREIDAVLEAAGSITGTVTIAGGAPAEGACVEAHWGDGIAGTDCVDADGTFEITGLRPGDYEVKFTTAALDHTIQYEWYDGIFNGAHTPVPVVAGESAVANADLAVGARVSLWVELPAGALLDGTLEFFDYDTGELVTVIEGDNHGDASIVIPPRRYRIHATGYTGATDMWFPNTAYESEARPFVPSSWGDTLFFQLVRESTISGVFRTEGLLTGDVVCATAWLETGELAQVECGAPGEPFVLHHLTNQRVFLWFTDGERGYFYPATTSAAKAQWIKPTHGEDTALHYVTIADPGPVVRGGSVALDIATSPASSGTATLYYRTSRSGSWQKSSTTSKVSAGVGTRVVKADGWREYYVVVGGISSNRVVVAPVTASITAHGSGDYLPGEVIHLGVEVDPAVSGKATMYYRTSPTGSWTKSSTTVSVAHGVGTRDVTMTAYRQYYFALGGAKSNVVTVQPPPLELSGPAEWVKGTSATLVLATDPGVNATATMYYRSSPTGKWTKSTTSTKIVNGVATRSTAPTGYREFYFTYLGRKSNVFALSPTVPIITASGGGAVVPGSEQTITIAADPAFTGSLALYVRTSPSGSWSKSSATAKVVNGAGSLVVKPDGYRQYRFSSGGGTSNTVTFTAPPLTVVPADGWTFGTPLELTLTTDVPVTAVATLYYRKSSSGSWSKSSTTTKIVNGVATRVVNPSVYTEYYFVYKGVKSNIVIVDPAA